MDYAVFINKKEMTCYTEKYEKEIGGERENNNTSLYQSIMKRESECVCVCVCVCVYLSSVLSRQLALFFPQNILGSFVESEIKCILVLFDF